MEDNESIEQQATSTPPTGGQGGWQGDYITVLVADASHEKYVDTILKTI